MVLASIKDTLSKFSPVTWQAFEIKAEAENVKASRLTWATAGSLPPGLRHLFVLWKTLKVRVDMLLSCFPYLFIPAITIPPHNSTFQLPLAKASKTLPTSAFLKILSSPIFLLRCRHSRGWRVCFRWNKAKNSGHRMDHNKQPQKALMNETKCLLSTFFFMLISVDPRVWFQAELAQRLLFHFFSYHWCHGLLMNPDGGDFSFSTTFRLKCCWWANACKTKEISFCLGWTLWWVTGSDCWAANTLN